MAAWLAPPVAECGEQDRRNRSSQRFAWGSSAIVAIVVAVLSTRAMSVPFWLTLVLLGSGAAVIVARPRLGVHLVVGFALLADNPTLPWYPFVKNGSSRESIFFIDDAVSLSPLEFYLLLTTVVWLLARSARSRPLQLGLLFRPMAAFTVFVVVGFFHGMASGGDRTVALWEVRSMLYLPLIYLLATNLFTERRHYRQLFWVIAVALFVEGLHGIRYLTTLSEEAAAYLDGRSLVEHSAAVHMNTLFVLALALWIFRFGGTTMRALLPVFAVPVFVVYLNSERRSAFVALIAALCVLAALLYQHRRRSFWLVVPAACVVFAGYLGVFWNDGSAAGYPAQAVKSVLAPGELDEQERSSDQYREIETYNLVTTIRSAPITGIGFGNKFLRPLPLPDISFVPFWEYIPHNSVLWLWTQAGLGGLLSFLYLVAAAVLHGLPAVRRAAPHADAALLTTAVLLWPMFAIYAYVDIAWDAQTALYLGVAAALVANFDRLPAVTNPPVEPTLQGALHVPR